MKKSISELLEEIKDLVYTAEKLLEAEEKKPVMEVDEWGDEVWKLDGVLHRDEEEGPAIVYSDGTKEYYKHGKAHRLGGPSYEAPGGLREWCLNGERKFTIYPDGTWKHYT